MTQDPTPSRALLLLIVLAIGCGAALQAPVFGALAPTLVPRRDIPGVMSLNMASWNGSRVVGPALGGLVYAQIGAPPVFLANAVSFVVVIAVVRRLPEAHSSRRERPGYRELLLGGFSILRTDRVARTAIVTMVVYTTCCLVHVVQLPLLADRHLGIASRSTTFGLFFAMLGLGATVGALSISTVFAGRRLHLVARGMLAGFAVCLAALAVVRSAALAFPVLLLSGLCYFGSTVAMSTVYQSRLDDRTRGRGSAMWLLAATGTAPIATLLGAWLIDASSLTSVMLGGSAVALGLAWYADLSAERDAATSRR